MKRKLLPLFLKQKNVMKTCVQWASWKATLFKKFSKSYSSCPSLGRGTKQHPVMEEFHAEGTLYFLSAEKTWTKKNTPSPSFVRLKIENSIESLRDEQKTKHFFCLSWTLGVPLHFLRIYEKAKSDTFTMGKNYLASYDSYSVTDQTSAFWLVPNDTQL